MARRRFGESVDRLRLERGYTVETLSGRSLIDAEDVQALIGGEVEPEVDDVYLLAGALGVEPGVLFEGVRWVPPAAGGAGYEFDGGWQR
jgi:transcriptional regulator with XRE-family HTH domain